MRPQRLDASDPLADGVVGGAVSTHQLSPGVSATHRGMHGFLQRRSVQDASWRGLVTLLIVLGCVPLLFPVAFMISTSLKATGDVFLIPIKWVPGIQFAAVWQNFADALTFMHWQVAYANTLKIAANNMVADVASAAVVAYGFSRFRARGKNTLFVLVLATLMIPYQVRLVPEYVGFSKLGLVDTLAPLMIPAWFGTAFNIFLLRQFFLTISIEMDEAAKMDGAGPIEVFFYVLLPQVKPALAVVAINSFTFSWNDFLRPLIYLNSPHNLTAAVALSYFQADYGGTPFNLLMAASLVMLIPVLVLFFVAQRFFIQGIVISGVKG